MSNEERARLTKLYGAETVDAVLGRVHSRTAKTGLAMSYPSDEKMRELWRRGAKEGRTNRLLLEWFQSVFSAPDFWVLEAVRPDGRVYARTVWELEPSWEEAEGHRVTPVYALRAPVTERLEDTEAAGLCTNCERSLVECDAAPCSPESVVSPSPPYTTPQAGGSMITRFWVLVTANGSVEARRNRPKTIRPTQVAVELVVDIPLSAWLPRPIPRASIVVPEGALTLPEPAVQVEVALPEGDMDAENAGRHASDGAGEAGLP